MTFERIAHHSLSLILYHRRGLVQIRFSEIQKVNVFSRPLLAQTCIHLSISIENISLSRNCDIKTINAKSVTDASIWVMRISKNSDTLKVVCLHVILLLSFPAMDFILGQLISLTNPIYIIPGKFVNKHGIRLFCDRAHLIIEIPLLSYAIYIVLIDNR